ncbi:MAG: hypothetical protein IJJ26_00470 [Victivallales bacterium]|nr:hypothetical protein [Victivallales bacterium]
MSKKRTIQITFPSAPHSQTKMQKNWKNGDASLKLDTLPILRMFPEIAFRRFVRLLFEGIAKRPFHRQNAASEGEVRIPDVVPHRV